jgi:hypothetical protein
LVSGRHTDGTKIIAGGSRPPLTAEAQQIEHDDQHEHDSPARARFRGIRVSIVLILTRRRRKATAQPSKSDAIDAKSILTRRRALNAVHHHEVITAENKAFDIIKDHIIMMSMIFE